MDEVTDADSAESAPVVLDSFRSDKRSKPFDVALGARVRALRIAAQMSQAALGQATGISFQQM